MSVHWHTDGDFHFAYSGPTYTGWWIRYDGTDYGLNFETRPQERFSQLAHAKEAAETDIRRHS